MPSARGMESVTSWTTRRAASALPVAGTTTTSRSGESTGGRRPAPHGGGQRGDRPARRGGGPPGDRPPLGLPVEGGQLGHRDDTGVDEVAEHVPGPDRGQLR